MGLECYLLNSDNARNEAKWWWYESRGTSRYAEYQQRLTRQGKRLKNRLLKISHRRKKKEERSWRKDDTTVRIRACLQRSQKNEYVKLAEPPPSE